MPAFGLKSLLITPLNIDGVLFTWILILPWPIFAAAIFLSGKMQAITKLVFSLKFASMCEYGGQFVG